MMFPRKCVLAALVCAAAAGLAAQEIVTAGRYLELVSERYNAIRDYEAEVSIQVGNTQMRGMVSHLGPGFLRIDFSYPAGQVIVYNGETFMAYLPADRVILSQNVAPQGAGAGAGVATARGLTLLRGSYIPAYAVGPGPVPIDEGSAERVVKLRLARRSASEGFIEIILDINPESQLVRRVTGTTLNGTRVRLDFSNIRVNPGIPPARFMFDTPPGTTVFNNFLFKDSD